MYFSQYFLNFKLNTAIIDAILCSLPKNGLKQKVTLCNIYRPPRERNEDIESFINDLAPILSTVSNERSDKMIVGDYNIDMLKILNFPDLMLDNDFLPKISLPTRFAEKCATIIDNIFCNLSHSTKSCCSGIIFTNLSDHLPYFVCLNQKTKLQGPP